MSMTIPLTNTKQVTTVDAEFHAELIARGPWFLNSDGHVESGTTGHEMRNVVVELAGQVPAGFAEAKRRQKISQRILTL